MVETKTIWIIGLILLILLMSGCAKDVIIPKEDMTCDQLKICYSEFGSCCLNWTNKPFKHWDCVFYGEQSKSADYIIEMVKKCNDG
jgi:hypothetical protein